MHWYIKCDNNNTTIMPTHLTVDTPREERDKYKIVDTRTMKDIGPKGAFIESADVALGRCVLKYKVCDGSFEEKVYELGPHNMVIVLR
jgi:hypothetical protein